MYVIHLVHISKDISTGLYRSGIFSSEVTKNLNQTGLNKRKRGCRHSWFQEPKWYYRHFFLPLNFSPVALFLGSLSLHSNNLLSCLCLICQQIPHHHHGKKLYSITLAKAPEWVSFGSTWVMYLFLNLSLYPRMIGLALSHNPTPTAWLG